MKGCTSKDRSKGTLMKGCTSKETSKGAPMKGCTSKGVQVRIEGKVHQ